jgi:hypothetical protein
MSYQLLPFKQSPNYTPGPQTKAFYGRPRTIEFGAGHWWDDPTRFPSFSGVVATLMNAARQASAHAVVGDGVVQPLVRPEDTSWATGSANPFTVSIETDPQIIYMWWGGGDKAKARRIFDTLAEYIADMGWHNLAWKPHKTWMNTGCNPIDWGAVMAEAKAVWQRKYGTPATPPAPANATIEWVKLPQPVEYVANKQPTKLWNFNQTDWAGFGNGVKDFNKGDHIVIVGKGINKNLNREYLVTQYSFDKKITNGFSTADLDVYVPPAPAPVVPEWQRNLKDISPVKLMVLVAQTPIVNLNDLSIIKQLGQGTYVDFAKSTTVGGVEYLISSYSATNAMPNGIRRADVGVPAEPPVNEKPEWFKNWQDIEDVKMYTRADTDLVNLEDGSTIKVIPRATEIAVASTTEWHGQKYAITQYSTENKLGQGIRIDDLDMKPVVDNPDPVEPAPEQPDIKEQINWLVKAVKAILAFFGIKL